MVFAPTRSGKGVGLILPTLLAWEDSSIVLDIKGENWALTAGWRKSQDQVVLRFDPSDPSGASARFNPLKEIRLDTLLAIPDVQSMAAMLVDPNGKGLEDQMLNKAENVTSSFSQSFKTRLSSSIKLLPDILTGYASSINHSNACPLLVHLLVRFWPVYCQKIAEIMKFLPLEVNHEIDRYLCQTQTG